jgi:hypothetical protein
MTVAITTLRSTIATVLDNPGVWSVFSFPPSTPLANSIVVSPDDPYLSVNDTNSDYNLNISPMARFKITLFAPMFDNQANLINLEDFMIAVYQKLMAQSSGLTFNAPSFSAPSVITLASGDLLSCDLSVSILTSWS